MFRFTSGGDCLTDWVDDASCLTCINHVIIVIIILTERAITLNIRLSIIGRLLVMLCIRYAHIIFFVYSVYLGYLSLFSSIRVIIIVLSILGVGVVVLVVVDVEWSSILFVLVLLDGSGSAYLLQNGSVRD